MDISVTFRHVEPTDNLKTYAEEKAEKIEKYFDYPVEFHIVLAVEKFRRMADVTLNVNGTVIKAVEVTEDMYSAIDQVMDKIEIEKLVAKPMDPEEAAMQLNMSQQDFLVFRNSHSRVINVIYKRKDGNLGLIDTTN
jgi:putative sigma-54 modulation protein